MNTLREQASPNNSAWLSAIITTAIDDMNLDHARERLGDVSACNGSTRDARARQLAATKTVGMALVKISQDWSMNRTYLGYGIIFPFTVKDIETGQQYDLNTVVDLHDGKVWVSNGTDRVSPIYNLNVGAKS